MAITPDRIEAAGKAWAAACARQAALSPRQAAEEAHQPGGPTVNELEARIRARRERAAEQARQGPTDTPEPTG